jgi:lipid-A-disaccharide synthase
MLVILPFEVDFYKKWGFEVIYTGHPLIEVVQTEIDTTPIVSLSSKPIIALLPGSRAQEIKTKLPLMLSVVDDFPDYQFIVAQAPSLPDNLLLDIIGNKNVLLAKNQTYNLLKQAKAGLITSGTATLETALFGLPQVVCYKGNPISYWLATKLVKIKYISLVNLIMNKSVVTELIQDNLNSKNLITELRKILDSSQGLESMKNDYKQLWQVLGQKSASTVSAKEIISLIS